ncbi:OsmC family protein [Marisediminicola senii]|uniref:OsmC family protein n=1 Tax=Marisediminicola senii TaxID=2711233 RepID=UPI0013EDC4BC|nr:OsmC family protein [Marisediminicola senii]
MQLDHHYAVRLRWTGNRGAGTRDYRAYGRDHDIEAVTADAASIATGAAPILGSSDPVFHGDATRWNPEQLLLSALSQCHLLSYLHTAVKHGVVVTAYTDSAVGTMVQTADGGGHFTSVTLSPVVTVASADMVDLAQSLHAEASTRCFIAASMNFAVLHEPSTRVAEPDAQ